jgi:hypothetical protein
MQIQKSEDYLVAVSFRSFRTEIRTELSKKKLFESTHMNTSDVFSVKGFSSS